MVLCVERARHAGVQAESQCDHQILIAVPHACGLQPESEDEEECCRCSGTCARGRTAYSRGDS